MRNAFIRTLTELAKHDARIVLLTGDLGFTVIEPFSKQFPDRYFNIGVAEQNMIGVATGMAEAGFIPFVYSIVNFAVMRPYEFIRNGPILHQFPVRLIGVGGGLEYSNNGATHFGLEDIGILRTQPGIQIIAPADALQASTALEKTWNFPMPIYYRLGKDDNTFVPGLDGMFEIDRFQIIREGSDILFLTLGNIALEAVKAAEKLAIQGIESTIGIVPCLSMVPMDLVDLLARFPLIMTVEAHFINGGLGSFISEIISENGIGNCVIRCGIRSVPDGITGSQEYLYRRFGISGDKLAEQVLTEMNKLRAVL